MNKLELMDKLAKVPDCYNESPVVMIDDEVEFAAEVRRVKLNIDTGEIELSR